MRRCESCQSNAIACVECRLTAALGQLTEEVFQNVRLRSEVSALVVSSRNQRQRISELEDDLEALSALLHEMTHRRKSAKGFLRRYLNRLRNRIMG